MSYNKKAHLRANIDAIKIALTLDKENRQATDAERQVLQQYSGFGGLKCVLNPASTLADTVSWAKSEIELFPLVSELHSVLRENTNDEREYRSYMSSIQNSVLSAFYTPPEVIGSINDALQEKGMVIDRFLDPSAGIGAFPSQFKLADEAESVCFEKDLLTGKILSTLHPESDVHTTGFERIEGRYTGYFDVVASNIPFGEMNVFDPTFSKSKEAAVQQSTKAIHNYFFVKGMESLREGGVMAFITSQGVMNAPANEPIRKWLMENANLVSAIRLPNNLFTESAGTEVGSDLIVLQKNTGKNKPLNIWEEYFITSSKSEETESFKNDYFYNNGRVVHTKTFMGTDPYGKPAQVFLHEGSMAEIADDMGQML